MYLSTEATAGWHIDYLSDTCAHLLRTTSPQRPLLLGPWVIFTDMALYTAYNGTPPNRTPGLQTPLYYGHMPLEPNDLLCFAIVHLQPPNRGHLNNQDSLFWSQGVQNRVVPLYCVVKPVLKTTYIEGPPVYRENCRLVQEPLK